MKLLSQILESYDNFEVSAREFSEYTEKMKRSLPKNVQTVCAYLEKAGIFDMESVEALCSGSSSKKNAILRGSGLSEAEAKDLQSLLKKMKLEKKLLPMYMTEEDREDLMKGTKTTDDIMLDLQSERGRTEVVKQYTPLMNKIANQYVGRSALGKEELLSAAMMGLVSAMNDYQSPSDVIDSEENVDNREEAKKNKHLSFLTYASYRIQQSILHDINWYSRTVRIPTKTQQRHKDDGTLGGGMVNIDKLIGNDPDSESIADRIKELSVDAADYELDDIEANISKASMKRIYDMIEKRFSMQKAAVFYKSFGLNGYEMEKHNAIAKEFGLSTANVSMINKRIAKFLKEEPSAQPLLNALLMHCQESIFIDNMNKSREEIIEALLQDDMYILLEDLTRWSDPVVLENTVNSVISRYDDESADFLVECLKSDFSFLEENYRDNRKLIVHFLENMNPTQSFNKKSDLYILNEMETIVNSYKKTIE